MKPAPLRMARWIVVHPVMALRQLTSYSQPLATWSWNSRPVQQIARARHFVAPAAQQEVQHFDLRPFAAQVFAREALP